MDISHCLSLVKTKTVALKKFGGLYLKLKHFAQNFLIICVINVLPDGKSFRIDLICLPH